MPVLIFMTPDDPICLSTLQLRKRGGIRLASALPQERPGSQSHHRTSSSCPDPPARLLCNAHSSWTGLQRKSSSHIIQREAAGLMRLAVHEGRNTSHQPRHYQVMWDPESTWFKLQNRPHTSCSQFRQHCTSPWAARPQRSCGNVWLLASCNAPWCTTLATRS